MKEKLEKALFFYKWATLIGSILFILNYLFWGTDDIIFIIIIVFVSLFLLVYFAVRYLIEIGNDIEIIKNKSKL